MKNHIIQKKALLSILFLSLMLAKGQNFVGNSSEPGSIIQKRESQVGINENNIQSFKISYSKTTHIISPEPIIYVDISSPDVEGDLPEKNIFRLKPKTTMAESGTPMAPDDNFTVTVVSESFITVYNLSFNEVERSPSNQQSTTYVLTIDPNKSIQINNNKKISNRDYEKLALRAMSNKRKIFNVFSKKNGMEFWLSNVYVIGDFILFDVGAKNRTNVEYDIYSVDFKLMDKHSVGATVSQDIELKPVYQFTEDAGTVIEKKWHNYYIFKKFTYPSQKALEIRLTEKQISGRPVSFKVDYKEILRSKTLITD